jgi:hypothetical protein
MTKLREPTETDKMSCPLCRDGYPIVDGRFHDALGFMWDCQAYEPELKLDLKSTERRIALTVGDVTIIGNVGGR